MFVEGLRNPPSQEGKERVEVVEEVLKRDQVELYGKAGVALVGKEVKRKQEMDRTATEVELDVTKEQVGTEEAALVHLVVSLVT